MLSIQRLGSVLCRNSRHRNISWTGWLYLWPDRDIRCPEILPAQAAGRNQLFCQARKASTLIRLQVRVFVQHVSVNASRAQFIASQLRRTGLPVLWGTKPTENVNYESGNAQSSRLNRELRGVLDQRMKRYSPCDRPKPLLS